MAGVPTFGAVTYRQPLGLDWSALGELIEPLARAESLVGISIADLEPDRDPDGGQTARVVAMLSEVLAWTMQTPQR